MVHDALGNPVFGETARDSYVVRRYRPRVEGLFARIEKWTRQSDGDVHWRSITQGNVTTLYGKGSNSRIFSPTDSDIGFLPRVFSWLICENYDSKGNAVIYTYKGEDSVGVDLSRACEFNRTDKTRAANRYLKSIKYGNRQPNRDDTWMATDPTALPEQTWMFKVVFDYGDAQIQCLPLAADSNGESMVSDTLQREKVRRFGQPINTTMLPDPVSALDMIGMGFFRESCPHSLLRSKEPLLRLSCFIQPSCGFFVWSRHSTIPLLFRGIMHHIPALGNSQSNRANLMKTQWIHILPPWLSRTEHEPSKAYAH
jgi:hypothetical protein